MSLHQLAIDAAAKEPYRPAVHGPGGTLTYRRLDNQANALAHHLRSSGVEPGDRVLIWSEKSAQVIVAMQAVLRLGAAYVPADEATPVGRAALLARECGARAVLTTSARLSPIREALESEALCLDLAGEWPHAPAPINTPVAPDALAYILFTSGSTGTPKGVCISHDNARAFVDWAVAELDASPDDRFANHAPLTFDLSVLDLYAAFAAAASVHLVPAELAYAPTQLVEFLYREQITVWYSVPSALTLMIHEGGLLSRPSPAALRSVLFAGEPFPIARVRELASWTTARLLNLYGPTETNVCTFHEVRPSDLRRDRPVPIGTPSCGDRVWARRADGTECGPGEEGELVVDGPTVMLGYWGHAPQEGPYFTGDMVLTLEDGSFDYRGRRDKMVKIRGHRIELGELEAVLEAHSGVAEACAVAVGHDMDARLVAFLVSCAEPAPGVLALRRHCAERLPRYLIPDEFRTIPELPRTRNGKLDRPTLASSLKTPRTESHVE